MVVLYVDHLRHLILQLIFFYHRSKVQSTKSLKRHNICIILYCGFMVISRQFWKNNLRAWLYDIFARLQSKIRRVATEYTRTQLEGIKYLLAAKPFRIK